MDSDQASMGTVEPLEYYPFWSKIGSWRWQCDKECCHYAASKCPQSLARHNEPFSKVIQGPHNSNVDKMFALEARIPYEKIFDCQKNKYAWI